MVSHDGATYIKPVQQYAADSLAVGTDNSTGVDCRGFRRALVIVNAGTATSGSAGSGSLAVTVQESSDDGSSDAYAAITGAAFAAITTANDEAIYIGSIDLTKRERYIRCSHVMTVGAASIEVSSCILLYEHLDSGWQDVSYAFTV